MRDLQRILVAGEGGQGIQVLSKTLATAGYLSGKKISFVPNYGIEQRGGVSLAFVQISNTEIGFPKFGYADILVVLAERAIPRIIEYLKEDTVLIYDPELISNDSIKDLKVKKVPILALAMAKEQLIGKVFNVIVLGFLASLLGIREKDVKKALEEGLGAKYKKKPELKHFNERAVEIGFEENKEKEALNV